MAFLYGRHFTLDDDDNTHVTILMEKNADSATVCLRYLTDSNSDTTLISISNGDSLSGVYLSKSDRDKYDIFVNGSFEMSFPKTAEKMGAWNSLCLTWNAESGARQLWVNGKESGEMKSGAPGSLTGGVVSPKITLGRRYSSVDFLIDLGQFNGELKDIHVWDSVLSSVEIQKYVDFKTDTEAFVPGNVVSWKALNYKVKGRYYLLREESKCE